LLLLGIAAAVVAGFTLFQAEFAAAGIWLGGAVTLVAGAFTSPRIGLHLARKLPDMASCAASVQKPANHQEETGDRHDALKNVLTAERQA
jgi:hypothetical protein